MQVSGSVNPSEIGGGYRVVNSAYQDSALVNGDNSFATTASMYNAQLLFVQDRNGQL
jgi:hypothetical protein